MTFYEPNRTLPRHRQLKLLVLAVRDMGESNFVLELANSYENDAPLRKHLLAIAVIYYARPFITTRGFGKVSGKWERFEHSEMKKLHDFICSWRDAAIAHSEDELNDVEFIPKGSKLEMKSEDGQSATFTLPAHGEFYRGPQFPEQRVGPFIRLCEFQQTRMKAASNLEKDKLFSEFLPPQE